MEQMSPDELKKAMKIYQERHGKGQVVLDKLEEIVKEMRDVQK
jgi:uncharacterized membrane protein